MKKKDRPKKKEVKKAKKVSKKKRPQPRDQDFSHLENDHFLD